MPRNVEIKARLESIAPLERQVATLADSGPTLIRQDDTFFYCRQGRLKLREFSPTEGELIFYRRSDVAGPKESFFVISKTTEPDSLREVLTLAYGKAGRVRKERTLYLIGNTRVHLDRVEDLGDFLELEVVLEDNDSLASGEETARQLLHRFYITEAQLVERAYIDLIIAQQQPFS